METNESSLTRRMVLAMGLAAGLTAQRRLEPFAPGFNLVTRHEARAPDGGGIEWWVLTRERGRSEPISLVWASVAGPRAGISIQPVDRRGSPRALYSSVRVPGAMALVNGSFFQGRAGRDERTMGLVRSGGRTLVPASGRRGGGFLIAEDRSLKIVPRADVAIAEAAQNAIESSPILITGGASGMRGDDRERADRVAVGSLRGGGMAIVGAFAAQQDTVSLFQFEQLAREAARRRGEVFVDLLAMDGGPSAHILLPASGNLFGSSQPIFLTNVVALTLS